MSDLSDLKKQLAEMRKSRETLEKLTKRSVVDGKVRVECIGPGRGKPCPHSDFRFVKAESAKEIKKKGWRCHKCWQVVVKRDREQSVVLANKNGWTPAALKDMEFVRDNVDRWALGPHGVLIPLAPGNVPLEKKYNLWWKLRQATKDNLPEGYFWCDRENFPRKRVKDDCDKCRHREKCLPYQVAKSERGLRDLVKRKAELDKPEKERKKVERAKKRLAEKELEAKKQRALQDILAKYSKGK